MVSVGRAVVVRHTTCFSSFTSVNILLCVSSTIQTSFFRITIHKLAGDRASLLCLSSYHPSSPPGRSRRTRRSNLWRLSHLPLCPPLLNFLPPSHIPRKTLLNLCLSRKLQVSIRPSGGTSDVSFTDGVEYRPDFGEPVRVDGGYLRHVLL